MNKEVKRPRLIDHLFRNQKGKCFYCGCSCIIKREHRTRDKKFKHPENLATVEHIFPKTDIRRFCTGGNKVVMACRGCNDQMNRLNVRLHAFEFGSNHEIKNLLRDLFEGVYSNQFVI